MEIRQRESITLGQEEECCTLEGSIAAVLEKTAAALLQEVK